MNNTLQVCYPHPYNIKEHERKETVPISINYNRRNDPHHQGRHKLICSHTDCLPNDANHHKNRPNAGISLLTFCLISVLKRHGEKHDVGGKRKRKEAVEIERIAKRSEYDTRVRE
jgi:hypothetical protein